MCPLFSSPMLRLVLAAAAAARKDSVENVGGDVLPDLESSDLDRLRLPGEAD